MTSLELAEAIATATVILILAAICMVPYWQDKRRERERRARTLARRRAILANAEASWQEMCRQIDAPTHDKEVTK